MQETCQSTANGRDLEFQLAVSMGIGKEALDISPDTCQGQGFDVLILGWNGKAIAVVSVRLSEASTFLFVGVEGSTCPVHTCFVGSENEDSIPSVGHEITQKPREKRAP